MSLSRREMNVLTGLLSKLQVNTPKPAAKKRRRRNRKSVASSPPQVALGTTRRTAASTSKGSSMGMVSVSRCELFSSVSIENKSNTYTVAGYVAMLPSSSVMPWLQKISIAFDRIEWLSAKLLWKPFVSATTSGSICFGIDWNSSVTDVPNRAKTQACTPVYESPVWQSGTLNLPKNLLMSRKSYTLSGGSAVDRQPGQLVWCLAGYDAIASGTKVYGEIWIEYSVRLSGTTA